MTVGELEALLKKVPEKETKITLRIAHKTGSTEHDVNSAALELSLSDASMTRVVLKGRGHREG